MKILVCGDRNWTSENAIYRVLYGMPKGTIIINGACRGADRLSTIVAKKLGFDVIEYPANWQEYGNAAGPIRNMEMYDTERPDLVIGFHASIHTSKGTRHMLKYTRKNGTPAILIIA